MQIPMFHVDAFTDNVFGGNPAAVCPLEQWLPDEMMQKIALKMRLQKRPFFYQLVTVLRCAGLRRKPAFLRIP